MHKMALQNRKSAISPINVVLSTILQLKSLITHFVASAIIINPTRNVSDCESLSSVWSFNVSTLVNSIPS